MPRRTVTEVYNRQIQHEKDDTREFKAINDRLDSIDKNLTPKVNEMHDYIIGQKAIDGNRSQGSWLSPDLVKIILALIAIIGAALGVNNIIK